LDIIFTVTNDLSYDQRMQRICTTMAHNGFKVELVGREKKNSTELKKTEFSQKRLKCIFNKGKAFYMEYNLRLFFYLLFKKSKVISAVDLDTLVPCTLIAIIINRKLVFDAHEYFTEVPEVTDRPIIKSFWEFVAITCIPRCDEAYTVGPMLAKIFSIKHNIDFKVVKNVPLLSSYSSLTSQESSANKTEKTILYQGALNEGRGLEECIMAMQNINNAKLLIAGEGDLSDELRALTSKFELNKKVIFLGYKTPEELRQLTKSAFVGINVLKPKGLSYYYSLANKFFDYMHSGIPCICADFPEYQEINQKFGFAILSDCETKSITSAMQQVLGDEQLYKSLCNQAKLAALEYNWETESTILINIYKKFF